MYSFGTAPPLISLAKMKSADSSPSSGSNWTLHRAYWPEPPDCFLCVKSTSAGAVMASRYETWGAPTLASTPNSRCKRSTMISKWSSPMPLMMVWAFSSSYFVRNDGSSAAKRANASPILSWSFLDLASTATLMTGSGKSIFSRITALSLSHNVSPVVVCFSPATAMISPATADLTSVRSLACIWSMRPTRSRWPFTEL